MKVLNVQSLTSVIHNLVLVVAFVLAGVGTLAGQTPRLLRFEQPVMEIDTVRYDAGPVKVRFTCTNISGKDVTILSVNSQCGCAKPSFSRASIRPGAKGFVDAVLDPSSLFAEQNRHLTVVATNLWMCDGRQWCCCQSGRFRNQWQRHR